MSVADDRLAAFPWVLFLLTWLIGFSVQHRMDAPAVLLDGGLSSSDLAQGAHSGDIHYQMTVVVLGVIGAVLLFRRRECLQFTGVIAGLLLTYIVWAGLSVTWAEDPTLTLRRLAGFALMLVFSAGCVTRMNVDILSVFIAGIAALNLIPGIIAELRLGTLHPFANGYRFAGTLNPNTEGAALSVAIIILTWWVWRLHGLKRFRLACISVVLLAFALMTGSRTSMIALVAAVGFSSLIILVRNHRDWLPRLIAALALTIGIAGLAGLALASVSDRFDLFSLIRTQRDDGDATTLTGRVDIWQESLAHVADHPLLGVGFGGFWSEKRIEMVNEKLVDPIKEGHSAYLDELLTLGLPGAGLYLLLLLGCLGTCIARFFRGDTCYGAWAALLLFVVIHNATESIHVSPPGPNFAFNLILLHLVFIKPRTSESLASLASRDIPQNAGETVMVPVSVIIPCYNSEATVERCLKSVLAQTMWPKQVIVVDDASNDGTLDVIDSVCRNFNGQLTVIRLSSNGGPSVARNTAWDLATQPYIAFLDSDDTWHHRKLELQYSWMKSHPETSLTCHGMRWIKRNEQPPELPDGWKSRKIRHVSLLIHCIISTPSVMLRRDLPFRFAEEKRNSEDYLLWLCIVLSGYDARVLDVPLAYTHKHFYKSSGLGSNVLGIVLGDLDTYRRLWRLRLLGTSAFVAVSLGSLLRFSVRYIRP